MFRFDDRTTREVEDGKRSRNMANRKPYRTKAQKAEARSTAVRRKDGSWHSPAPVSYHPVPRGER